MQKSLKNLFLSSMMLISILFILSIQVKAEEVTTWTELKTAIDQPTTSVTIKLNCDITADNSSDSALVIAAGKNVTIDLNSKKIDRNLSSAVEDAVEDGYVIKVEEGAYLTITDSSTGRNGKITGGNNSNSSKGGGGILVNGTLTVQYISIDRNIAQGNGGGIYNDGGIVNLQYGSSVTNNLANNDGGGIYNEGGTVNIQYSSVENNEAIFNGGGIYNGDGSNYSFVSFHSSIIHNCYAKNGAGVYNVSNGRFEMGGGGQITACMAYENGGAVYTKNGGTSTFSGGAVIENCIANLGAGIFTDGVLGLEYMEVKNCKASVNGSGVYVDSQGRIFAGNTAKVYANKKDEANNNIYIVEGGIITLGSGMDVPAPFNGMKLGISMEKPGIFTTNGKDTYAQYFISDDASLNFIFVNANSFDGIDYDCFAFVNTFEFETNGGTGIQPGMIISNTLLSKPVSPTKTDFVFNGWFTDEGLQNEYDFTKPVLTNLKLYAKWGTKKDPDPEPDPLPPDPEPDPEPEPEEQPYYIESLEDQLDVAIAYAQEDETIVWTEGDSLPQSVIDLILQSDVTVEFKFTYEGVDYDLFLNKFNVKDLKLDWYGPYVLAQFANNTAVGAEELEGDTYTVKAGDTMGAIAERFGMSLEALTALNPQITDIDFIRVNQKIRVK